MFGCFFPGFADGPDPRQSGEFEDLVHILLPVDENQFSVLGIHLFPDSKQKGDHGRTHVVEFGEVQHQLRSGQLFDRPENILSDLIDVGPVGFGQTLLDDKNGFPAIRDDFVELRGIWLFFG